MFVGVCGLVVAEVDKGEASALLFVGLTLLDLFL